MGEESLSGDPDRQLASKLNVIEDNFQRALGPGGGWRRLLLRQRRMRAIRDIAWSTRQAGDVLRSPRYAGMALREWPLDPKLWAVAAVTGFEAARKRAR